MSGRKAKALRRAAPKTLSLADRASAALADQERAARIDSAALKRLAEHQAREAMRVALLSRGLVTVDQAAKLDIQAEVTIQGPKVYAIPFAKVDGLRFRLRQTSRHGTTELLLQVMCAKCRVALWSTNIEDLASLGYAMKARWQHTEGACPQKHRRVP